MPPLSTNNLYYIPGGADGRASRVGSLVDETRDQAAVTGGVYMATNDYALTELSVGEAARAIAQGRTTSRRVVGACRIASTRATK